MSIGDYDPRYAPTDTGAHPRDIAEPTTFINEHIRLNAVRQLLNDKLEDLTQMTELRAENERLREAMEDAADDCLCGKHIDAAETLRTALASKAAEGG